jgi:hypothetical protein
LKTEPGDFMKKNLLFFLLSVILILDFTYAQTPSTHFRFISNTGNFGTILLPSSVIPKIINTQLSTGDEIGVYTPKWQCCGGSVYTQNQNIIITIWGDNTYTGWYGRLQDPPKDTIEGIGPDEKIYFAVWIKSKNKEYSNITFSYASTSVNRDTYTPNGIYTLASLVLPSKVEEPGKISDFRLQQNYPNPFNPTTNIDFSIAGSGPVQVLLKVYDVLGREVTTVVNRSYSPGSYSVQFDGKGLQSGVYYYKLEAGEYTSMKKMMLMK